MQWQNSPVNYCFLILQMEEENPLTKRKPVPLTHIFNPLSRAIEDMEQKRNMETKQLDGVHASPRGALHL